MRVIQPLIDILYDTDSESNPEDKTKVIANSVNPEAIFATKHFR